MAGIYSEFLNDAANVAAILTFFAGAVALLWRWWKRPPKSE
jgi:hypothetical protein